MVKAEVLQKANVQEKVTGVVKWFDLKKGIGFIQCEEHQFDIFVHYSNILTQGFKQLKAKNKVEFYLHKSSKGYSAKHVTIIP